MKGLLHSKLFRQKLSRWLFMYIAVICLASTVITYSRYMSSLQGNGKASAAKFDVRIRENEVVDNGVSKDYSTIRPRERVTYSFTVDATNLEVSADIYTTISVSNKFSILRIDKTIGENTTTVYDANGTGSFSSSNATHNNIVSENTVKVSDEETQKIIEYEVVFQYKEGSTTTNGDITYESDIPSVEDAIIVGFSAIQID